ncbi:hypothetical protein THRCLA_00172 [Thraustotheca clavata]|uniref:Uncharacterized protein n=1 Tax=Thraustotheca clavata TaxID=74557 RepID=A0A1W0AC08_9STRA|nr:hypothetical protein THRCLA_00172 [Thraustotheca clavata]
MSEQQDESSAIASKDVVSSERSKPRPGYIRTTPMAYLDPRENKVKRQSPTNDALLRESLQVQADSNMSVTTATTQLKVLCRKFAVLSEKVKQEAKLREEAEREIKRLNDIIEGNKNMIYIRSLQDDLDHTKHELQLTQDELKKTKTELERDRGGSRSYPLGSYSYQADISHVVDHQSKWDREQMQKIQETLTCTINELQDELLTKDQQADALRENLQREKTKVKDLERTIQVIEDQAQSAKEITAKTTQELRDAAANQNNERHKLHLAQETIKEERSIKEALQHQLKTLHQVNDALQRRCDTLVRRLKLNDNLSIEAQNLKTQILEMEREHEHLLKSMRDLKSQHFDQINDIKATLHEAHATNQELNKRILEQQTEMMGLRSQNAIISEYSSYNRSKSEPAIPSRIFPTIYQEPSRTRISSYPPVSEIRSVEKHIVPEFRDIPLSMKTNPENEQPRGKVVRQNGESDHSILRALKHRNKQLQERLQQEADATYQLEEEINMITSSYHSLLQNEA